MTKWIIAVSGIITAIALGYFYWELKNLQQSPSAPLVIELNAVTLTHSFKDGIHRYVGALRLPHSCYTIAPDITNDHTTPPNLTIKLTTKDSLTEKGFCVQLPTTVPFEVITDAPKEASVSLRIDGTKTPVKLIETEWQNPRGTILNLEKP